MDGRFFEGRDHLIPMGRPELETSPNMNTVGIMLRLTRVLWSTRKEVITEIRFCVLKGLLEMRKRRVYGSELIQNSHYWPMGGLWRCH